MDGLNDQSLLDVRKLITGKDGRLFVTTKAGTNLFLAEVDTFQTQISPANTDYQPVGSALVYAVNTGYSVTLTLTEAVVRDNVMISELITDLQNGYFPSFDFQGKCAGGTDSRSVWSTATAYRTAPSTCRTLTPARSLRERGVSASTRPRKCSNSLRRPTGLRWNKGENRP